MPQPPQIPEAPEDPTFVERAERNLKAVQKLLKSEDSTPERRAELQLQQANVLALLELADAIRSTGGRGD